MASDNIVQFPKIYEQEFSTTTQSSLGPAFQRSPLAMVSADLSGSTRQEPIVSKVDDPEASRPGGRSDAMPDSPTREEMNAKLEAVEARLEARFVAIDGKLDRLAVVVESSTKAMHGDITSMRGDMQRIEAGMAEVKRDNRFTRWTIGGIAIAAAIASLAALWQTQSNLLSAFTAGLSVIQSTSKPPATQPVPVPQQADK